MVKEPNILAKLQGTQLPCDTAPIDKRKLLTEAQAREVDAGRAIVDSYGNYHQFGTWRSFQTLDVVVVLLISATLLFLAA